MKLTFAAELGDYDLAEHSPELVSEFRFLPIQTEEMELAIFEKWKEYRYETFDHTFFNSTIIVISYLFSSISILGIEFILHTLLFFTLLFFISEVRHQHKLKPII